MDVIPVGFADLKQLHSGWSSIEEQLRQKAGQPFLVEMISAVRVRYEGVVAHNYPEANFVARTKIQFIAGIINEKPQFQPSGIYGIIVVPCVEHVTWNASDESGMSYLSDDDLLLGISMVDTFNKMCRISIGEREVSERIEELFAQKPDGPQTLSALVFSSALKKVGIQMFGPNFSAQFTKEVERSLKDIVEGLLKIDGKGNMFAYQSEQEEVNSKYALLVNAGMREDDLCDLIATHVMRRTCGWFFRERGVHCVAVALGEGET